ncbi:MAG: N-acetyltransferase [Desulfobacteraceae bacterium]|nr:N-acetyltransferase [Desulfobacteraceae bacterium]
MDTAIRKARMEDIKPIYGLLKHFGEKGLLLGRSLSSLYEQLRDFEVCEISIGDDARVVGVCALHICWENLAEIRSLAIAEEWQGKGVGTRLIESSLAEAKRLGINRVFTLTYQPSFFRRLEFRDIDKNELPHKVWSDCLHCPKFPDCNEEALIWEQQPGAVS